MCRVGFGLSLDGGGGRLGRATGRHACPAWAVALKSPTLPSPLQPFPLAPTMQRRSAHERPPGNGGAPAPDPGETALCHAPPAGPGACGPELHHHPVLHLGVPAGALGLWGMRAHRFTSPALILRGSGCWRPAHTVSQADERVREGWECRQGPGCPAGRLVSHGLSHHERD